MTSVFSKPWTKCPSCSSFVPELPHSVSGVSVCAYYKSNQPRMTVDERDIPEEMREAGLKKAEAILKEVRGVMEKMTTEEQALPNPNDGLATWDSWNVAIEKFADGKDPKAMKFWVELSELFNKEFPLPKLSYTGDDDMGVRFSWNRIGWFAEVEFFSNGEVDWFYTNRESKEFDGNDDTLFELPKRFFELLGRHLVIGLWRIEMPCPKSWTSV